jgi:hypothetical protein
MWLVWIVVTVISVAALNVEAREITNVRSLFGPANAVLMVLAGCGVIQSFAPKSSSIKITPIGDENHEL